VTRDPVSDSPFIVPMGKYHSGVRGKKNASRGIP